MVRRALSGLVAAMSFASVLAVTLGAVLATVLLAPTPPALASLPDNRAYELVSPVEMGGASTMPGLAVPDETLTTTGKYAEHVLVDGGVANALLSSGASWMLESRTPTGWSGVQVGPPSEPEPEKPLELAKSYIAERTTSLGAVSKDLSSFLFQTAIPLNPRNKSSSAHVPSIDDYVSNATGSFTWASGPPAPAEKVAEEVGTCGQDECVENNAYFAGASANLSDVVWSQRLPLVAPPAELPGSPPDTHAAGDEVYESVNGADQQLVGQVPAAGTECGPSSGSCVVPPCGATMGNVSDGRFDSGFAPVEGAVSGDGSQVVFMSPDPGTKTTPGCAPAGVYLRDGGTSTVDLSASQRAGGDPHGPREKVYAGSAEENGEINTVFFTSSEELTDESNTGSEDQGNDLYAYNLTKPEGKRLTDLTPDSNPADANGASVISFIGSSTSGSLVYFTASGALTSAPNAQGQTAQAGADNLYVYDAANGQTTFIASGNGVEGALVGRNGNGIYYADRHVTSELTPDGRQLVFVSSENLTSYRQQGDAEIYLYEVAGNRLDCVSCNPSGAPPAGSAMLPREFPEGYAVPAPGTLPRPLVVSEDGSRVFFSSPDQLTAEAPEPTPTRAYEFLTGAGDLEPNAYEYEGGHVYLIAPAAAFLTTTSSGNDVFFDTLAQLVPQGTDGLPNVYDARVSGGFPVLAAPACSGASCQGVPASAPIFETPPSATFNGVGNFPAAPAVSTKPPTLTRAQQLAKALKACHAKHGRKTRASCEAIAKKRYGIKAKSKKKAKKASNDKRAGR